MATLQVEQHRFGFGRDNIPFHSTVPLITNGRAELEMEYFWRPGQLLLRLPYSAPYFYAVQKRPPGSGSLRNCLEVLWKLKSLRDVSQRTYCNENTLKFHGRESGMLNSI